MVPFCSFSSGVTLTSLNTGKGWMTGGETVRSGWTAPPPENQRNGEVTGTGWVPESAPE